MQSDIEIDKALALAIGWNGNCVRNIGEVVILYTKRYAWRVFSHRDWNVIGPIAARYDCFPSRFRNGTRTEWGAYSTAYGFADTPQRAIALAVIGAKK
jgi:hypothetical protein